MASLPHYLSASLHTNFIKRSRALQYPFHLHSASSNFPSSIVRRKQPILQTKALPDPSLFLTAAASDPGSSRSLSALLPVSGFMLLLYWLTNFVVPDLVMKDLRAKESAEGEEAQEMETPTTLDASSKAPLQNSTRAKKRNPKTSSKV